MIKQQIRAVFVVCIKGLKDTKKLHEVSNSDVRIGQGIKTPNFINFSFQTRCGQCNGSRR
jgi:hypothetical protein